MGIHLGMDARIPVTCVSVVTEPSAPSWSPSAELLRLPASGTNKIRLPGEAPYSYGRMIALATNRLAFALGWDPGHDYAGGVDIVELRTNGEPSLLLTYGGASRPWYSTLYFMDINNDGAKDILIDREVLSFTKQTIARERMAYLFDLQKSQFKLHTFTKKEINK